MQLFDALNSCMALCCAGVLSRARAKGFAANRPGIRSLTSARYPDFAISQYIKDTAAYGKNSMG